MARDKQKQDSQIAGQQARRKILKGLAGLPAVVTLSNGAFAASDSALQCLQTLDAPASNVEIDAGDLVPNTSGTPTGSENANCVCDPDATLPTDSTALDPNGSCGGVLNVEQPLPPTNFPEGDPVFNAGPGTPLRRHYSDVDGNGSSFDHYCVEYIDSFGEPVGRVQATESVAATASCYASIINSPSP